MSLMISTNKFSIIPFRNVCRSTTPRRKYFRPCTSYGPSRFFDPCTIHPRSAPPSYKTGYRNPGGEREGRMAYINMIQDTL